MGSKVGKATYGHRYYKIQRNDERKRIIRLTEKQFTHPDFEITPGYNGQKDITMYFIDLATKQQLAGEEIEKRKKMEEKKN